MCLTEQGVDVVVAAPGRAREHLSAGTLRLDDAAAVVLDEADLLLSEFHSFITMDWGSQVTCRGSSAGRNLLGQMCRSADLLCGVAGAILPGADVM